MVQHSLVAICPSKCDSLNFQVFEMWRFFFKTTFKLRELEILNPKAESLANLHSGVAILRSKYGCLV